MDKEDITHTHTHTHTHTQEHYSVTKENEILPFVTTWVGPETKVRQRKTDTV